MEFAFWVLDQICAVELVVWDLDQILALETGYWALFSFWTVVPSWGTDALIWVVGSTVNMR